MRCEKYRSELDVLDLMGELRRLVVVKRRADRLICRYLADLADRLPTSPGLFLAYGDIIELARARFGLSGRSVRERLRVGRALRVLPVLDAAFMSGILCYSRVREVTRAATPDTERYWLAAARDLSIRALERRVVEVKGGPAPRARVHAEPAVPEAIWGLLKQAMWSARVALGRELSDEAALAAVAHAAIAFYGGSVADAGPSQATHSGSPAPTANVGAASAEATSRAGEAGVDAMTHSGSRAATGSVGAGDVQATSRGGEVGVDRTTHSGSRASAGSAETKGGAGEAQVDTSTDSHSEPLSADAQLLLDRICAEGPCHFATLCDTMGMPTTRFACALFDLEVRHLVRRSQFGWYEASLKRVG